MRPPDRRIALAALALVFLAPRSAPPASPADARITAEVEEALTRSADLAGQSRLKVKCEEGILTISGTAETLFMLREAARVSATVPGVLDVVLAARVLGGKLFDSQVRLAVAKALDLPAGATREMRAEVAFGKVRLLGSAGSYGQKKLIEDAVARVPGVLSIENQIEVTASTNADGSALGRRVLRKILEENHAVGRKLAVTVEDRKAVLRGRVPLYLHRLQAAEAALSVPGVLEVDNRLIVDPSLAAVVSHSATP